MDAETLINEIQSMGQLLELMRSMETLQIISRILNGITIGLMLAIAIDIKRILKKIKKEEQEDGKEK